MRKGALYGRSFPPLFVVAFQLALLALVFYAVLRGIRWAVANGIRDAQKKADAERATAERDGAS